MRTNTQSNIFVLQTTAALLAIIAAVPAYADPGGYVSPFEIDLSPDISSWTPDIAARNDTVNTNDGSWYTNPPSGNATYGPLNVQLFSTANPINPTNQSVEDTIAYDRGFTIQTSQAINPVPVGVDPVTYDEQRLLYVASTMIGTTYQHLHLPTFNPWANGYTIQGGTPPNWPWSPVTNTANDTTTHGTQVLNIYQPVYGTGTAGIDCTDFAAYLYNVGLGIQLNSGTATQITFSSGNKPEVGNTPSAAVLASDGTIITPNFLMSPNYGTTTPNAPGSLDGIMSQLHPGDLLYITGDPGSNVTHVVIWLGTYGRYVGGNFTEVPLVISSHDNTPNIYDVWGSNLDPVTGLPIDPNTHLPIDPTDAAAIAQYLPPPGVEILPFIPDTWFYENFAVASQILPAPVPEPSSATVIAGATAMAVTAGVRRRKKSQSA